MKEPYQYQEEAIQNAMLRNVLVADECGLGKTLTAIETVRRLQNTWHVMWQRPVLVLCPKKVGPQWKEEIRAQIPEAEVYIAEAAGRGLPDIIQGRMWIILHYEALLYISEKLASVHWSVIIADEAHRVKNRKAKRTKALKKLGAVRRIALTGTPLEKMPGDFWSILNWLYPDHYRSYWQFTYRYCAFKENYMGFRSYAGPRNLEELGSKIGPYTHRRTKEQVAPQLPPKIFQTVPLEMDKRQQAAYDSVANRNDLLVDIKYSRKPDPMIITTVLAQIVRLQQIASNPELLDIDAPSTKLEWICDYIEDNPAEPIVIFSRFRKNVEWLADKLGADVVIGGMKGKPAQAFLEGKTNVLVGTIAAMGEGLSLDRATTAIFMDQEWSATKMSQAIDRVHRIVSKVPKTIIYLKSLGTVDEDILEAVEKKWSDANLAYQYINRYTNAFKD